MPDEPFDKRKHEAWSLINKYCTETCHLGPLKCAPGCPLHRAASLIYQTPPPLPDNVVRFDDLRGGTM